MTLIYNFLLLIVTIIYTPIHLVKLCISEKYRSSTWARLGFQKIPKFRGEEPVYWLHSVSVGETQVAGTVVKELLTRQPNAKIVISTITETGQAVAKKIPGVAATFYYPLDFSFLANSMLRRLQPTAVFVVETDLWFNFLNGARRRGIPAYLINGKMSSTTLKRYRQLPWLSKKLLGPFHHFFVQSDTYAVRYFRSGIAEKDVTIAGNVKLDSVVPQVDEDMKSEMYKRFGLDKEKPIVVFGSTHAGEEELAVDVFEKLKKSQADVQLILVPRHPERFDAVAEMIKSRGVTFTRASEAGSRLSDFVLVDEMGLLMKLYALCDVAVVAGSFTPHIGGHNIFEPSFYGKPFVYGPWIYKQPGFHQMNLEFKAGVQCQPEELVGKLGKLLENKPLCEELGRRGFEALEVSKGATAKIVSEVLKELDS